MKGDFSRQGFDPEQHFSRVLMQQGRVLLDDDFNKQTSMLLHYLRSFIRDFLGPVAPVGDGFLIEPLPDSSGPLDFLITAGHLYVDGLLCENPETTPPTAYSNQPYLPDPAQGPITGPHLVYIDVWEQHITYLQEPRIREVALGGPDTTTRARTTWQAKLLDLEEVADLEDTSCKGVLERWDDLLESWQPRLRGELRAQTQEPSGFAADDPCITAPDARYRGAANRLYRVEIHNGGTADEGATFKWSRENGSVVFPVISLSGAVAKVESLGLDDLQTLAPGMWVELVDDHTELSDGPGQLAVVESVDSVDGTIELTAPPSGSLTSYDDDLTTNPLLRRWDYEHQEDADAVHATNGAIAINEDAWIPLEDGIAVWFGASSDPAHRYRTGDYWLIPARTATGDIEWPIDDDRDPMLVGPHGVEHHYASLGVFSGDQIKDCRHSQTSDQSTTETQLPEEIGAELGLAPITFVTGGSDLTDDGKAELDKVVAFLLQTPGNIEIGGHTDSDGNRGLNQTLSQDRADAVKSYLESLGVPAESMTATGFGDEQPIAPNDTPENKARNRRIEFRPS